MNMSRQFLDKTSVEKLGLEFLDEYSTKDSFQWDSNSSNEENIFNSKSEVLWSREKNEINSQNDVLRGLQDGFSDFTEGSSSSCSWHNEDFDMNSSNKVKASLEAIEDALYEQQESTLINRTVFQECCDWSNKFPYFRLKGKQISRLNEDCSLPSSSQLTFNNVPGSSFSSLQVEGKKMAIHVPTKKTIFDKSANCQLNDAQNFSEETLFDDGEYEEDILFDTNRDTCIKTSHSQVIDEKSTNITSANSIEDKVIERVALEVWPKVIEILQKLDDTHITDTNEDFQLPPIVPIIGQKQVLRRPRTEGTDEYTPDFPRLNSLLSISPKVLQNKREYGSWRANRRPRPNSEMQLHRRNHSVPSLKSKHEHPKVFSLSSQQIDSKSAQLLCSKPIVKEKDNESMSLLLPAVNEDSQEPSDILQDFYLNPEMKELTAVSSDATNLKKPECFLPPISRKNYMPSNTKLTRNLFTFFGPQFKSDIHNNERPATRPNTTASRKVLKYSGNLKHKLSNDEHSFVNHSSPAEAKKLEVNIEKPVTLFPIVTSLIPPKERNASAGKKGLLNTFGGGRKR